MHEVSLGKTIQDYLTGEMMEETTYEELRQGIARVLVEEKGFAREDVRPRLELHLQIDDNPVVGRLDFGVFEGKKPLLLLLFCPGEVGTFLREGLAAARLLDPPFPLVAVTDTREAILAASADGQVLAQGYQALPSKEHAQELAREHGPPALSNEQRAKEARLFYAYTGYHSCCTAGCQAKT
ncbi:MAG: type I restriction endonuclease subunit R [Desulfovibrionales bacterium]